MCSEEGGKSRVIHTRAGVSVSLDAIDQHSELDQIRTKLEADGYEPTAVAHFCHLWLEGHYSRAWRFLHRPRCGARKADGSTCIQRPAPGRARCKWHGGADTTPRTPEGQKRRLEALARGRETQSRLRAERQRLSVDISS